MLDRLGLVDALEWFTSDFEKRTGSPVSSNISRSRALHDKVATAAYRIAQEALTNVVRHAQASCVNVVLQGRNGSLSLAGPTTAGASIPPGPRRWRVWGSSACGSVPPLAGGELQVNSGNGQGTQVYFQVPLSTEKDAP